jgi:2-desacetyl-2-hydroxyethyl bacteriochlorophyllide A dehydrogenase
MKAAVIETPGRVIVREVPDPQPAPDEVIVSVALAGLCGTDLHIYAGEINYIYPIIPGHEVVGTIVEVGDGVADLTPGVRAAFDPNIPCGQCHFCRRLRFNHCLNWQAIGVTRDGGFAEQVAVPAKVVYPLGDLPFERAVFIEPLSCVVYGLQRATPALGDRVLIFGAGPIGMLLMQAVRRAGAAQVVVTDLQQERLELGARLGADATVLAGEDEDQRAALRELAPQGYDMVIDATGVPTVVARCFDYVTPGGKLLLFGVCPEGATIPFRPFDLYRRDISVYGSFALNVTFGPAIELLRGGAVQVEPLISHRFPLERFPQALEMARTRSEPAMKIVIQP